MGKSNRKTASSKKPPKPYPEFPLCSTSNGYWQKKIRGEIKYFGRWGKVVDGQLVRLPNDGWKEALALYKARAEDLHNGRLPRADSGEGLTVAQLCDRFLKSKLRKMDSGGITERTFAELKQTTDLLVKQFGRRLVEDLRPDDFEHLRAELAQSCGPVRLGNLIVRIRGIFKYAIDNGLIDRTVRFGSEFARPPANVVRKHRASREKKLFTADEIRRMLGKATTQMRAMILLAINGGMGNTDVASLPLSAIDWEGGWLNYPRPKTGIDRRIKLWDETLAALRTVVADRPQPKTKEDRNIVFISRYGQRWIRMRKVKTTDAGPDFVPTDSVSTSFGVLVRELKIKRDHVGFYSLRHTYRTVGDSTLDFPALKATMGHADGSIDAHYVEGIDDSRLVAVSEHVRQWLFGATEGGAK